MEDLIIDIPHNYNKILEATNEAGFTMPSDLQTGSMLRTLVTSKPGGNFLELGTGTGLSLSWIVEAMDKKSQVTSVDIDETLIAIAQEFFSSDYRVKLICQDGAHWIEQNADQRFDLIFADAWPGKYEHLDETLSMLKVGGIFFIDDMVEQPNWPEGHAEKAKKLLKQLSSRRDLQLTKLNWSTGLVLATKING